MSDLDYEEPRATKRTLWRCLCGNEIEAFELPACETCAGPTCPECRYVCGNCGQHGCEQCMYQDANGDGWFCADDKTRQTSACHRAYVAYWEAKEARWDQAVRWSRAEKAG